jgi:ceramide glucosyltransferase
MMPPLTVGIPSALAVLSFGIVTWQFIAAQRFPLHRRSPNPGFAPGISLLKPLKGLDPDHSEQCLMSWLTQNYAGPLQFLFVVADANDPVVPLVQRLIAAHPHRDARLLIFPERVGANAKVSKLAQAEGLIAHDLVLVSDADVLAPTDLLSQMVLPLQDTGVALVHSFYRSANPSNAAMEWEATAMNADFWSQVLQSRMLAPMDFALGAAMLVRRSALESIGGFRALADYLADDFQLGHRIVAGGGRIELTPVIVECLDVPTGWKTIWTHQVRWNRTIRVCRPGPYIASILANGTVWNALAAAVVWWHPALSSRERGPWLGLFMGLIIARSLMAQLLAQQLAAVPGRPSRGDSFVFGMAAAKDLLGAAVWVAAIFGNTVHWRGIDYSVDREGRLTPLPNSTG